MLYENFIIFYNLSFSNNPNVKISYYSAYHIVTNDRCRDLSTTAWIN